MSDGAGRERDVGLLAVVRRYPQFRRLWFAQVVSQFGDWLNRMALLVLIGNLEDPSARVGLGALFSFELAIRLLPAAVFGPLAGPVADRLPRRFLMVTADFVRAALVLCFLLVEDRSQLSLLYVILAAQMSVGIFFDAARSASLPNTVPRSSLHAAYALSAATWSAMLSVGAFAGGVLVHWVGVRGVFVVDAATYLLSALLLRKLTLPAVPSHSEPFRWRDVVLLVELRRALQHLHALGLTPIIMAKSFWGAAGGFLVVLSLVGRVRFGDLVAPADAELAAAGLATGLLFSARGLGTGLGPILLRRFFGSSDRSLRWQISAGFFVAAAGYALFAQTESLAVTYLLVVFAHMGGSGLWVASTTYWQKHVSDAFRGRVFALEFLGMTMAFSAGGLLAGWFYDRSDSISLTTWLVCAGVVLNGLCWSYLAKGVGLGSGSTQRS